MPILGFAFGKLAMDSLQWEKIKRYFNGMQKNICGEFFKIMFSLKHTVKYDTKD